MLELDATQLPDNPDRAGPPPDQLLRNVHIFSSAVRDILDHRFLRAATHLAITPAQLHLLRLVDLRGSQALGRVAAFLGVSTPAASKAVDKLVCLGLLRRVTPDTDRRTTHLHITRAGRAVLRAYSDRRAAGLRPVLARFAPTELAQLSALLERFATSLIETAGPDGATCLRCGGLYLEGCPVQPARGACPYEQAQRTRT